MFHGQIEREFSDGEPWSTEHQCKLPTHLQLLVEQEQKKRDIWELPTPQLDDKVVNKNFYQCWNIIWRFWRKILF